MAINIVFQKQIPVFSDHLPPEPSVDLDFWTFFVVFRDFQTEKARTLEKIQVCQDIDRETVTTPQNFEIHL
jgi:hypothetical protein